MAEGGEGYNLTSPPPLAEGGSFELNPLSPLPWALQTQVWPGKHPQVLPGVLPHSLAGLFGLKKEEEKKKEKKKKKQKDFSALKSYQVC